MLFSIFRVLVLDLKLYIEHFSKQIFKFRIIEIAKRGNYGEYGGLCLCFFDKRKNFGTVRAYKYVYPNQLN